MPIKHIHIKNKDIIRGYEVKVNNSENMCVLPGSATFQGYAELIDHFYQIHSPFLPGSLSFVDQLTANCIEPNWVSICFVTLTVAEPFCFVFVVSFRVLSCLIIYCVLLCLPYLVVCLLHLSCLLVSVVSYHVIVSCHAFSTSIVLCRVLSVCLSVCLLVLFLRDGWLTDYPSEYWSMALCQGDLPFLISWLFLT